MTIVSLFQFYIVVLLGQFSTEVQNNLYDLVVGGKKLNNDFGQKAIEKALLYAEHEWYASEKNVMHHRWIEEAYEDLRAKLLM